MHVGIDEFEPNTQGKLNDKCGHNFNFFLLGYIKVLGAAVA